MDLRNQLKELTKQGYNTLELCVIRDIQESEHTVTVEPVNRPEFVDTTDQNTYKPNFIYGIKYSPSKINTTFTPGKNGDLCIVGFTDKYNGYILLTESVRSTTIINNQTGSNVTFSLNDQNKIIAEFNKINAWKSIETNGGNNAMVSGQENVSMSTDAGARVNIKSDIDILAGIDSKIRIATQAKKTVNKKSTIQTFLKNNDKSIPYSQSSIYYFCIDLLRFYSFVLTNPKDFLKEYGITNVKFYNDIPFIQMLLVNKKFEQIQISEYANEFKNIDGNETFLTTFKIEDKEGIENKIRSYIYAIGIIIEGHLHNRGKTVNETLYPVPDSVIYNNVIKFNGLYNSLTINNSINYNLNIIISYLYNNSKICGFYFRMIKKIIEHIINDYFSILPDPKLYIDFFKNNLYTETQESQVTTDEMIIIEEINNIETTISLKDVIINQNEIINKLTTIIQTLTNPGGITCTGGPITITPTVISDVQTLLLPTGDIATNKDDITLLLK